MRDILGNTGQGDRQKERENNMTRKHHFVNFALCCLAALSGLSGCKKDPPAQEAPAVSESAQAADKTEVSAPTPNAEGSDKPEVEKTPVPIPAFNEESLARARSRASAKREKMPCPKGAKFKDGMCVCPAASGKDAERKKCMLEPKAYPLFSSDFECVPNFWECYQTVMCTNPEGCHTADGMHYGPYYEYGYIVGGVDTSVESYGSTYGTCVLDRTDGIPLFSVRPDNNSDFACDQDFCPCASDTCILGEVCKAGACVADSSPLPELNDGNSEDVAADSLPKYIDGMPEKTFNVIKCVGGKHYCHSAGFKPMLRPGDDYDCVTVASLPGIHRTGLKAWLCNGKDCPCDNTKCNVREVCIDGACHKPECHGEGQPAMTPPARNAEDYTCREVASIPGTRRPGLMAWVCDNRYGCLCSDLLPMEGGTKCKEGEICVDEKCYKP